MTQRNLPDLSTGLEGTSCPICATGTLRSGERRQRIEYEGRVYSYTERGMFCDYCQKWLAEAREEREATWHALLKAVGAEVVRPPPPSRWPRGRLGEEIAKAETGDATQARLLLGMAALQLRRNGELEPDLAVYVADRLEEVVKSRHQNAGRSLGIVPSRGSPEKPRMPSGKGFDNTVHHYAKVMYGRLWKKHLDDARRDLIDLHRHLEHVPLKERIRLTYASFRSTNLRAKPNKAGTPDAETATAEWLDISPNTVRKTQKTPPHKPQMTGADCVGQPRNDAHIATFRRYIHDADRLTWHHRRGDHQLVHHRAVRRTPEPAPSNSEGCRLSRRPL